MECPKCHSEELDIVGGPDFAHGSSEEILLVWECYSCGTQFSVLYELEPIDTEILE